ncbi:MAG: IS5 family transposase [Cyanobacteria bacterium J06623_5]
MTNTRPAYDTDLTQSQWQVLAPLIPAAKSGGRPRSTNILEVLNAIFYLMRAGCAWRLLPHDFPKWQTVYYYFRQWQQDKTWEAINTRLREQVRVQAGRSLQPSAGSIDSQSVKTAGAAQERGWDGGKRVNGRKRTIIVDTMGLLLGAVVHSAGRSDHKGLILLATWFAAVWTSLQVIWTDSTFGGKRFTAWVQETFGWVLAVVKRQEGQQGFAVLPKRWVVERCSFGEYSPNGERTRERTFAWFGRYRRLSKDYEYLPTTSETMLYVAMVNIMVRRLA